MKSVTLNVLILFGLIFSANQSIAGNGNIKILLPVIRLHEY